MKAYLCSMRKYQISSTNFSSEKKVLSPIIDQLETDGKEVVSNIIKNKSFDEIADAIRKEDLNLALLPLQFIPINKPSSFVIAGLTERKEAGEVLVIKKERTTTGKLLKLGEGATVIVFTKMQKAQLQHFRDDLNIIVKSWEDLFAKSDFSFESDAALLPSWFLADGFADFEKIPLLPEEFIPSAGQGVFAFCCHKSNVELRRTFKPFHKKETSTITNIERGIERALPFPSAVFCTRDRFNHFHVYASAFRDGQLYNFSHSASTSIGLVERVVEELGG